MAKYEYKLISYDSADSTEAALNEAATEEFRFVTVIAASAGPALLLEREVPTNEAKPAVPTMFPSLRRPTRTRTT